MLKPLIGIAVILLVSAAIAFAGSQGSVTIGPYALFALCASIGFLLHWAVFIPSFIFQTEHYFDLTGGMSYLSTVGLAYLAHPAMDSRGLVLCLMVAIWSTRVPYPLELFGPHASDPFLDSHSGTAPGNNADLL